jgi:FMN phosphatase YigB (HAD superfamily)
MAILSNFDHGSSLHALIERHGIRDWFETVVVSADIGWRKPSRKAFEAALAGVDLPSDAILHVGDTWVADVEGARASWLDVAWINAKGEPVPQESMATYVVERLTDLEPLLD